MKSLKDYQKAIGEAAAIKFPTNKKWTQQDRLLSMQRQLANIGAAYQIETGIYTDKCIHNSTDHSIAALIADALILAHARSTNIEAEMEKALDWYLS